MEPRKKLRRYHEPGHLHELTFSCFRRLPLLDSDDRRRNLVRCIDSAGEETNVKLLAFVFMPEHVHLLVQPDDLNPRLDLYLARIKQPFSEQVHLELAAENPELVERLTVQERPGKKTFRFWMPGGGYDRNLFTPEAIAASLHYLHSNPVKRGLCERSIDWKWSSFRFYADANFRPDPDLPRLTSLPMGSLH
ncbi:MAG TPA: transposase [Pirellulaceae bacterium]|jgi:putative transposase|nr:transposase [Pirellulaceae bacterium]